MSLRALSGEHEAKKLLQSKYQIRTAVFWGLQAFHEFKFSPFKTRFIQKPLQTWASIRDSGFLVPGVSSTEQSRSSFPKLING